MLDEHTLESKPVSGLIKEALQQFSSLIRSEFALARAEISEKSQVVAKGAATVAIGGLLAVPSLALLLMALAAFMMELGMRGSLACLLSSIVGLVVAGLCALTGMKQLKANTLVPNRTIEQLHRDAAAAKELF